MSGIAPSSVNFIFKDFVTRFSAAFQEDYIKFHSGDRKAQMDLLYAMMGAPGNIGSMDATHSPRLNKCPGHLKHQCEGKEGYPTLAWMCIVDHFKYIQYVSMAYYGASNDKGICNADAFCRGLQAGSHGGDTFDMIDELGRGGCPPFPVNKRIEKRGEHCTGQVGEEVAPEELLLVHRPVEKGREIQVGLPKLANPVKIVLRPSH
jgi:hypothetical protein